MRPKLAVQGETEGLESILVGATLHTCSCFATYYLIVNIVFSDFQHYPICSVSVEFKHSRPLCHPCFGYSVI